MITGELKSKINAVWDAFWSGGISNPLEVIEQITYLLFIRRLDDIQTLAEKKARATGTNVENPVFLPGQRHLRWSEFKNASPEVMYRTVGDSTSTSQYPPKSWTLCLRSTRLSEAAASPSFQALTVTHVPGQNS